MNPEPQEPKTNTRPAFRLLAGILALLFAVAACWNIYAALESTGPIDLWRWGVGAALFLLTGFGFAYGACTGRWPARKG
jgi:hypothetical protein